jgi:hypothetical protein
VAIDTIDRQAIKRFNSDTSRLLIRATMALYWMVQRNGAYLMIKGSLLAVERRGCLYFVVCISVIAFVLSIFVSTRQQQQQQAISMGVNVAVEIPI